MDRSNPTLFAKSFVAPLGGVGATKIVVLGGGISGYGSAILAKRRGFEVFLSDAGTIADGYKSALERWDVPFEEGGHSVERILQADEVIKSPGIPDTAPVVKALSDKGIPVVSEIEFAGRYTGARTICVTGSNGKTTTTSLIFEMLRDAGFRVGLGGNIGESFALQVADESDAPRDWYVLELSSFQLDGCRDFRADIAVLTNITPDHLDRYDYSFDKYAASKMRVARNQTAGDVFIFQGDDPKTRQMVGLMAASLKAQQLPFFGPDNYAAATLAALAAGAPEESIKRTLAGFRAPDHRMQSVGTFAGVEWINDSKATNVDSVVYAFRTLAARSERSSSRTGAVAEFSGPAGGFVAQDGREGLRDPNLIWIAGGTDKGNDYTPLFEFAPRVKALVCMGLDNAKLLREFAGRIPEIHDTHSLDEALKAARNAATEGDTVLLSPACASFDLFKNYEDRGTQFKEWILRNINS